MDYYFTSAKHTKHSCNSIQLQEDLYVKSVNITKQIEEWVERSKHISKVEKQERVQANLLAAVMIDY